MERTLAIIKPDGLQRGLVGKIISRIEEKGFKMIGLKLMKIDRELAERHYSVHKGKHFFEPLINYITSGPVVVMCLEGKNACEVLRRMVGKTDCCEAQPGTIRGDLGLSARFNLIHASDSPESAIQEIQLFFEPDELIEYHKTIDNWVYDLTGEAPV